MNARERLKNARKTLRGCKMSMVRANDESDKKPPNARFRRKLLLSKRRKSRGDWQSCRRKHRFKSEHEASQFASKCSERYKFCRMRTYYCDMCGGWHLTKSDYRKNKVNTE